MKNAHQHFPQPGFILNDLKAGIGRALKYLRSSEGLFFLLEFHLHTLASTLSQLLTQHPQSARGLMRMTAINR